MKKIGESDFGFVQDQMINIRKKVGLCCEQRSAGNCFTIQFAAFFDDLIDPILSVLS